jgi:SAM-dependent methyltransferase
VLKQPDEIRGAYSATETAEQYIDERFTSAWGSVLHAAQVGIVNDVIATRGVKEVLEIAPGPARISRDVHGFERGYLCEFNQSMVNVARHRLAAVDARWQIVRGDGFHLPFRKPVDLVYSFRFIRHFGQTDRAALYHQIRSVLKDRGLLVFDAVNVDVGLPSVLREGLDRHRIYDEFYKREALVAELVQHGFTPIALHDVIRHMTLQQQIQVLVGPRSNGLARRLIEWLEYVPGSPLEWIVVCEKTTAH